MALLKTRADVAEVAAAVAIAAEDELLSARGDPVLGNVVWLLAQLPIAARSDHFAADLVALGFDHGSEQSLFSLAAGFTCAVERQTRGVEWRTDLGALAQQAASETLTALIAGQLPGLFGSSADDLRIEIAKFASKDRFARLAREFFARLTNKTLDYYLSRVVADHVGPERTIETLQDQEPFRRALALHCREASEIVEQFAGGWFSKARYEGRLTPTSAQSFSDYSLKKMRDELRSRRAGDA